MIRKACSDALLAGCLLLLAAAAHADLEFSGAWLRAVPPVSPTMAGYVTLTNTGDETVTVTGAQTEIAGHAMLHGMKTLEDGSKKMFHLHRLAIAAGEAVSLAPGGNHLMLMQLERVPAEGEEVEVCFLLEKGEPGCTVFPVKRTSPSDS